MVDNVRHGSAVLVLSKAGHALFPDADEDMSWECHKC